MGSTIYAKSGSRSTSMQMQLNLDGWERVTDALTRTKPHLRDATVPVMERLAEQVAEGARARLQPGHPRNLFRRKGSRKGADGLYPVSAGTYRASRKGAYLFQVQGSGGATGRAQVLAEFAQYAVRPQGKALANALDSIYGPPGRVLWHSADKVSDRALIEIEAAVAKAAAALEGDMGSV